MFLIKYLNLSIINSAVTLYLFYYYTASGALTQAWVLPKASNWVKGFLVLEFQTFRYIAFSLVFSCYRHDKRAWYMWWIWPFQTFLRSVNTGIFCQ